MIEVSYYVYIIYSKRVDRYYIGCSKNPKRRVKFHNLGKGGGRKAFTKRARDWKLVYIREFNSKSKASEYERKLKQTKSRRCIEDIIKQSKKTKGA